MLELCASNGLVITVVRRSVSVGAGNLKIRWWTPEVKDRCHLAKRAASRRTISWC